MIEEVLSKARTWTVVQGDCREILKQIPDNSVDSVVTDPPYDLLQASRGGSGRLNEPDNPYGRHGSRGGGFMGMAWDATGVAFQKETWEEVLRVLKPGGHLLAFGGDRTHHRLWCAVEDAGFEIRQSVVWAYGQGFPKSLNVSQALDKKAGVKRPVVGKYQPPNGKEWKLQQAADSSVEAAPGTFTASGRRTLDITAPVTEDAKKWEGWGTALKPAVEFIVLARKPLSERNVAANVVKHGTGAINVDGTRISTGETLTRKLGKTTVSPSGWKSTNRSEIAGKDGGRWPANLILSHAEGCVLQGTKMVHAPVINQWVDGAKPFGGGAGHPYQTVKTGDENGMEEVEDWACVDGCPVRELDLQSGELTSGKEPEGGFIRHAPDVREGIYGGGKGLWKDEQVAGSLFGDTGGASRFFKTFGPLPDSPFGYFPKASRGEREVGLDALKKGHTLGPMAGRGQPGLKCRTCGKWKASGNPCKCAKPDWEQVPFDRPDVANTHPTVKSVDLMSWLCKMVTPPDGVVLDPFTGSGSTGIAALKQGFRFIGIEQNEEYTEIAKRRIEGDSPLFNMA